LISALLLIVRAALELIPPLFQKVIIDEVITSRDLTYIGVLIACLVGIYALQQLVSVGDNYIRHSLGEKFIFDFACLLRTHVNRRADVPGYQRSQRTGALCYPRIGIDCR
jgi:ABC-type multidrug transport system fused ATPase/permease subunit